MKWKKDVKGNEEHRKSPLFRSISKRSLKKIFFLQDSWPFSTVLIGRQAYQDVLVFCRDVVVYGVIWLVHWHGCTQRAWSVSWGPSPLCCLDFPAPKSRPSCWKRCRMAHVCYNSTYFVGQKAPTTYRSRKWSMVANQCNSVSELLEGSRNTWAAAIFFISVASYALRNTMPCHRLKCHTLPLMALDIKFDAAETSNDTKSHRQ